MKCSIETGINGSPSFLDVKIFRETQSLSLAFSEKLRLVGYTLISSVFFPLEHKFGLVRSSLNRYFDLSSDFLKFHHEVDN